MSKPSVEPESHKKRAHQRSYRRGRWAETRARLALMFTGHRILAANYRTPVGEIDLIAKRGDTLSIIEVKARPSAAAAAEAITAKQRARITRATEHFLKTNSSLQTSNIRFDVCLAIGPWRLKWIRDAW